MNKLRTFSTIAVLFAVLATSTVAHAQATRTWVSGVGSDANPCSRTAPCATFAGAFSKTAAGGIIEVLDPGGFGAVTITNAITIDGGGNVAGVLVAGVDGITVQAGNTDMVRLVRLDIEGVGSGLNGIRYLSGGQLIVDNSRIYGFTQAAIDVEPSDGAAHGLTVQDTELHRNAGGGILLKPSGGASVNATVNRIRATGNAFGIRAQDGTTVNIHDSVANSNTGSGFEAISSSAATRMSIAASLSVNHTGAADAAGVKSSGAGATVRIAGVSSLNNSKGLSALGGGSLISLCDNYIAGNSIDGTPTGTTSLPCPPPGGLPHIVDFPFLFK